MVGALLAAGLGIDHLHVRAEKRIAWRAAGDTGCFERWHLHRLVAVMTGRDTELNLVHARENFMRRTASKIRRRSLKDKTCTTPAMQTREDVRRPNYRPWLRQHRIAALRVSIIPVLGTEASAPAWRVAACSVAPT